MTHLHVDVAAVAAGIVAAKMWVAHRSFKRRGSLRPVAVFDADHPPAIAFIRSLGAAGVPVTTYSEGPHPPGRYSRFSSAFRRAPDPLKSDTFIDWLAGEMDSGAIDLVAPTSDYVVFNTTQALARVAPRSGGYAPSANVNDCLFKGRFATAMEAAGFPAPPTRTPTSTAEALTDAAELGYPLVMKPRSHIGVGVARGMVVTSAAELERAFVPYDLFDGHGHQAALAVDPDLRFPLLQRYLDPASIDVISVSGVLDQDGSLLALGHSRKTHQWPPRLGVGTQFEALGPQPFTERAVAAVQRVLGHGVFELEVLVDRATGEHYPIDLNPRGFGQMALDVASGRDLPVLWYNTVAERPIGSARRVGPPPKYWRMGVTYYAGAMARRVQGRPHGAVLDTSDDRGAAGVIGPVWDPRDPLPGVLFAVGGLRHPGGLVRPYLADTEVTAEVDAEGTLQSSFNP